MSMEKVDRAVGQMKEHVQHSVPPAASMTEGLNGLINNFADARDMLKKAAEHVRAGVKSLRDTLPPQSVLSEDLRNALSCSLEAGLAERGSDEDMQAHVVILSSIGMKVAGHSLYTPAHLETYEGHARMLDTLREDLLGAAKAATPHRDSFQEYSEERAPALVEALTSFQQRTNGQE